MKTIPILTLAWSCKVLYVLSKKQENKALVMH